MTRAPAHHRLVRSLVAAVLTGLLVLPLSVGASEDSFITPNNWGATGLMEIPTARVLKENTYRFGAGQVYPYRYYYGAIGALKGLEIDGRFTEIIGVKALTSGYGYYKDKAFDLKYQFIPEMKYLPAMALGIMDPHGTRLYTGQYLVASKRIYPFDFTIGLGNGRFGKRPLPPQGEGIQVELFQDPRQWLDDANFFWGIQFSPSPRYAFMVEYNPIEYEKQIYDPAQPKYFTRPVPLKYNFGFRWRPWDWADVDVTYQRGNQWGLNLSTLFNIGDPLLPISDRPYIETGRDKSNPLEARLALGLRQSGFSSIGVLFDGKDLYVEAQNDKYFYTTRALYVILGLVNDMAPLTVKGVRVVIKDLEIPVVDFHTAREDIAERLSDKLTLGEFFYLSKMETRTTMTPGPELKYRKLFDYGVKPAFNTFINDPSGFFKYRLGVEGWLGYHPWQGSNFFVNVGAYPFNTISTNTAPLSIPVRTDIVPYIDKNLTLNRLMWEQIAKFDYNTYAKVGLGYLEIQYGGAEGEVALPLWDGRVLVGASGSVVRKREAGKPFEFKSDDYRSYYDPVFFNTRLNIPEREIFFDVKAGRFMAGDKGVRVSVSKFIKGVTVSAWYTWTDTSIFSDPYNKGYHDKGILVTIPMRLFEGTDSKTTFNYTLTPWTRDVGQDIYHHLNLFDYMGRNLPIFLKKDRIRAEGG